MWTPYVNFEAQYQIQQRYYLYAYNGISPVNQC